jgi:hypothetical protein
LHHVAAATYTQKTEAGPNDLREKLPKGAQIFKSKRPVEAKSDASDVASTASCNKKPTWPPPNNSRGALLENSIGS